MTGVVGESGVLIELVALAKLVEASRLVGLLRCKCLRSGASVVVCCGLMFRWMKWKGERCCERVYVGETVWTVVRVDEGIRSWCGVDPW